jgi:hypothetical protein
MIDSSEKGLFAKLTVELEITGAQNINIQLRATDPLFNSLR